jgi:DNA-binding NarL/FixJ family response regulator
MSCRMLIVEDEFLLAGGLEAWVKQAGHEVCGVVSSASAALFLAKTQKPDIVLMDINLSGPVDGIEAARAILRIHNCGIVYITAYSDASTRERVRKTTPGAVLLPKPTRWSDLEAACARVSLCISEPSGQHR